MKKINLKIGGMSCSACSSSLEKHLKKQDGIIDASVNLVLAQALITYDEKKLNYKDFDKFINDVGFQNLGEYKFEEDKKNNKKIILLVFLLILVLLMYVSMAHMIHLPVIPFLHMIDYPINYSLCLFILTIPFLIYGFEIIKTAKVIS